MEDFNAPVSVDGGDVSQRKSRRGIYLALLAIVLVGGSVSAYFAASSGLISLPFLGGAPYENDKVISGLVMGIAKINKASYEVSLTGQSEAKDADAKPFNLVVKSDGQDALLKKDQDTFRDIQSVLSKLQSYYFLKKVYPTTLKAAGVADSLASTFTYQRQNNGKGIELKVTFQTSEAVTEAKRGGAKIVQGKTVAITSAKSYFYFSGKSSQAEFAEVFSMQEEYLQMVPRDYKLAVLVSGAADITDKKVLNNGQLSVKGDVTLSGTSFGLDVEGRKVGDMYYGVINKMPFLFGKFSDIIGKWVAFTADDTGGFTSGILGVNPSEIEEEYTENREKVQQQLITFIEIAEREKLLLVEGNPIKEDVAGATAYKYNLTFDKNNIIQFYKAVTTEFQTKYGNNTEIQFDQETLDFLESDEFAQVFEYLKNNTDLVVWFTPNGIPVKYSYSMRVVPSTKSTLGEERQIKHVFEVTLKNVNKNIDIKAPANSIPLEDAVVALTGVSKEEYRHQKRITEIESIRQALRSYKDATGSYPNSLNDLKKSMAELKNNKSSKDTYYNKPLLAKPPTGVTYTKSGASYRLVYTITLPSYVKGTSAQSMYTYFYPEASSSSFSYTYGLKVVQGTNTATEKNLSEEARTQVKKDTDKDLLSDSLETYLGTNKNKKDTDGDGYNDGQEIQSYTDPLGPGRIERGGGSGFF